MKKHFPFVTLFIAICSIMSCKSAEEACIDQSKVDPEKICTMEYKPVCGCDGQTYGNACEADKAGVTSYQDGACPESN